MERRLRFHLPRNRLRSALVVAPPRAGAAREISAGKLSRKKYYSAQEMLAEVERFERGRDVSE